MLSVLFWVKVHHPLNTKLIFERILSPAHQSCIHFVMRRHGMHPLYLKKAIAVGANNGMRGFVLPDGFSVDSVKPPTLDYWASINKKDIEWYNTLSPKKDWRKLVNNMNQMVYEKEYFPTSVYDSIHIPVMIVIGDRDMISIEHGLEMNRLIKNSQYCVLPNTTHDVFSERPDLINRIAIITGMCMLS